ncbi:pesticin C-terminus-like muramidase [Pseudomonas viridiflava]|uniref:pesticin C-terminus-like muramidase n=1 Tax=Pseudomonas viridiflava TaxID=33069 RepID=UPI002EB6470C|nr:pesticin C-terminus-like muramidase [Pseudomonas viridiflava]MEE3972853.1 pesticin C-terminus-like muramidase [Pseudomonas viridiflava]MEE4018115.1 pesticin C-terminus-like muramidase [Pseudomonas viridiflava]MEE4046613.1 pesticin C-terminus-like muramidase [Pseudomonas viridiflava]
MTSHAVDMAFIAGFEGLRATRGYVPDIQNSRSGVTIGTGFDIGQRNEKDLQKLKEQQSFALPEHICARLRPYLGLIREDALNQLHTLPLALTEQEARTIDDAYAEYFTAHLMMTYNAVASQKFESLPAAMQTVIASVAFQYGDLSKRTPKFWEQVTAREWAAAASNLEHFGDRYASRRVKEAALLRSALRA